MVLRRSGCSAIVLVMCVQGCVQAQDNGLHPATALSEKAATIQQVAVTATPTARRGNVDLPRFPSISPDGAQIVFSWRGDLWKVSSAGGLATRLTTHLGDDGRSAWSRDGTRIAFDSNRDGPRNIYIMSAEGADVRRVTEIDAACTLTGFGTDNNGDEILTFDSSLEGDPYRSRRPFKVSVNGGDILRVHDAFGSHPVVCSDGSIVAFTRGGSSWSRRGYHGPDARDVWLYDSVNGAFSRVTSWHGNDGKAKWFGRDELMFLADRKWDTANLYRTTITAGGAKAKRLTSFRENDVQDFDVSADGKTVVLAVWDALYVLRPDEPNAEPAPLAIRAGEDEADNYKIKSIDRDVSEAQLSPDGKVMAFVAYGEVFVRNIEEKSPTRRVTHDHAREKHITWSPDGLKLYFVSDRDGTDSVYSAAVALTRGELKEEFEKATKPPKDETKDKDPTTQPDEDDGAPLATSQPTTAEATTSKPATSQSTTTRPAASQPTTSAAAADTDTEGGKKKVDEELPKHLDPKRWHEAIKFDIKPVIVAETNDRAPSPSMDGKSLAFRRGRGDLMILDLESGVIRPLATGWDTGLRWRWSPDSRHIAYTQSDMNFNADIWVVPADGSEPAVNVTRHPDNDRRPRWSADGKILSFISERVNEEYDLWMVYLDKDLEAMTPKELDKYYKDAAKAAKKRKPLNHDKEGCEDENGDDNGDGERESGDEDANGDGQDSDEDAKDEDQDEEGDKKDKEEPPKELDLDDAYLRVRRVTRFNGSEGNNAITPGGDQYIFTANIDTPGLFSIKWDGTDRKRLMAAASVRQVSLTGDKIVVVSDGRAATVPPSGGEVEYVDIEDKIRIDLQAQSSQKFLEAARVLGEQFYHPTMKGVDWPRLTRKYHALAGQARTADEFNHVAARFLGELNASHLGVYARDATSPNAQSMGRLGTVHRRVEDGFEVLDVVPEGPAAKGPMALEVGDVITAIEFKGLGPTDTIESRLRGRVDKETVLTIRRKIDLPQQSDATTPTSATATTQSDEEASGRPEDTGSSEDARPTELNILLTPIAYGRERQLKYRAWRHENARLVNDRSDGRIGYIHIQGMGQSALDVFERDLYAAAGGKEGLIIDVRNNGGGWTADRVLASIMVQKHAYTIPRGADPSHTDGYPQDRLFIQRYTLPINMMCNEKSFSNAEIVSHAFKTLKRGKLVGQETYGGVISTGGTRLIDGTWVRLPFRGWYVAGGVDMENSGAMPDILVPQTPEAESADNDEQLRAATDDLLQRLDSPR